jgi:hypothetical protein
VILEQKGLYIRTDTEWPDPQVTFDATLSTGWILVVAFDDKFVTIHHPRLGTMKIPREHFTDALFAKIGMRI